MQTSEYFREILLRHEIILPDATHSGSAITCTKDPIRAVKKLEHSLKLESHRIEDFIQGLLQFFRIDENLFLSMSPIMIVDETKHASSPSFNAFFGQDDTFLKLLLRLPVIQTTLIEFLIQRMMVLSENESEQLDSSHPALKLLNHIRWCDVIYQPKTVVELLMVRKLNDKVTAMNYYILMNGSVLSFLL